MEIVIMGGGKVGEKLCETLSSNKHNIVLIEQNEHLLEKLINTYDINGFIGNGAAIETQRESGVASSDIFIAVTEKDEINIIAAILAKRLGAQYTVARVRNPEYATDLQFVRESLGISLLVNPEYETAHNIARMLNFPASLSVESFVGEQVSIIELVIEEGSVLDRLNLIEFRKKYEKVIIVAINRQGEIIIPAGDDQLHVGDHIHITGPNKELIRFSLKTLQDHQLTINSALIVGGGRIGYYLLEELRKSHVQVKLIENNEGLAENLSFHFTDAEIIVADGTDQDILDEEAIDQYDAFISLTGIDEENLMMSIYAHHRGVKKVITKLDRKRLLEIIDHQNLGSIVTPKQLVANEIIQFVRSRQESRYANVEALYRMVDNRVEAWQFKIKEASPVYQVPLSSLNLKDHLLVAYIIRNNKVIFPTGSDRIELGDQVIVITKDHKLKDIADIVYKGKRVRP
ncbi:MAG: Trk system potassium transporter TrkA [Erysipelothrix sp.]|nr:Trk system potassium transporter TrkA [Erysipelothrix sp.]